MKLLFDQNLSPRLPARLADTFPGSEHVDALGMGTAPDEAVWEFARIHGLVVVTKDEDYSLLGALRGWPPKVLWLLTGNCSTDRVEHVLRTHTASILAFESDPAAGVLALS